MKLQSALTVLALVVSGALLGAMIAPSASAQMGQSTPTVGRYQMNVIPYGENSTVTFICDTTNGQCWQGQYNNGGANWYDLGSPTKDKGRR